jgi:hypothetical protein
MHPTTILAAFVILATLAAPAAAQPIQLDYVELEPCRVINTRDGSGASTSDVPAGPRSSPGPFDVQIKGFCGVPADAVAVTLNVTVVEPTQDGDLRIANLDADPFPLVSTLNYAGGTAALANGAVVPLKPGLVDDARILFAMIAPGTLHALLDVSGYFVADPVQSIVGGDGVSVTNVGGAVTVALDGGAGEGPEGPSGPTGPSGPSGPAGDPAPVDPPFTSSQILHVNKAGADLLAQDGSDEQPFLTITHALTRILDASPAKRYEIRLGPGTYDETIHLKANVQLVGAGAPFTRIQGAMDIDDPSWTGASFEDHRSGFSNLTLASATQTFDFAAVDSTGGKLVFVDVIFAGGVPTFTARSTSVNQVDARGCRFANGYTQNGINMLMVASYVSFGTITINSQATTDAQVKLVGGGTAGDVVINTFSGHIPIDPLWLLGFAIKGNLVVNGHNTVITRIYATVDSIPNAANVTLVGTNTTLTRLNDAFGLAYTPGDASDWAAPAPTTLQEAIDRLAAQAGPVP